MFKKFAIIFLVLVNVGCDQLTKNAVRKNIVARETVELVGQNFIMTKVENSGAMLGFGSDLSPTIKLIVLKILPVIVLFILLIRILNNTEMKNWLVFAFCCVIGGGIGNLIDRFAYGEVTDFFHIDLGGIFKTGIFNMADVSVSLGVVMILILSLRYRKLDI